MSEDLLVNLFQELGLDEKKAKETAKNKKLSQQLVFVLENSGCSEEERGSKGALLYNLASTRTNKTSEDHLSFIAKQIAQGAISTDIQVQEALKYTASLSSPFSEEEFKKASGVGIQVSAEEISSVVSSVVSQNKESILEERYATNQGLLMRQIRSFNSNMKWASGKTIKDNLDRELEGLLGPKSEEDKLIKSKRVTIANPSPHINVDVDGESRRVFEGEVLKLHKPGENPQISEEIRQQHLRATGGMYITRFPPEPNGFLHIGHAKAMNFSFRFAELHKGITYLRYDDTNPEAEKQIYYDAIKDAVEWMGFNPHHVTAASDYFQQLYEYAIILIKKGFAYVCHQTQEEIHASRGGDAKGPRTPSPWRDRPIEENLRLFDDMKNGKFKEGEATLRLKMDISNPNPFMWDLIAYRILYTPHCRTGTQWCIYPMYDFTHCLCDSIENITHSLCTTEFISAREAYYWVCDHVEVYKPVQWEYGRLRLNNTVLSKRKLTKLVQDGIVRGWDDPRIYTLAAVRRRGFPPKAINRFVERLGITTAFSVVDVRLLESTVRDELNETAPRRMAILDPLCVIIENLPSEHLQMISLPDFSEQTNNSQQSSANDQKQVPFTRRIYIDRSDFEPSSDDENFYRLTPKQPVGLYKVGVIEYLRSEKDSSGKVSTIYAKLLQNTDNESFKPKTFIQWVADSPSHRSPVHCQVRMYHPLFKSSNPENVPGGFLADINPNSLEVLPNAMADCRLLTAKVEDKFQFQRIGYFCVDPDSDIKTHNYVFNLTVSLREDSSKTH
jgi:glutaminyl-tRNA synthetase